MTRRLHRAFFAVAAKLPPPLSTRVRGGVFDLLYASGTPWPYADSPFEAAKRRHLLAHLPSGAEIIVEIGCADGHNLMAMADAAPEARLIGVDISRRAYRLAVRNLGHVQQAEVVHGRAGDLVDRRPDLRGRIDAVVFSEVLYYLGGGRDLARQVAPISRLLAPGARVIAVHTCADASSLHADLARALDLVPVCDDEVAAEGRRFIVSSFESPR